MPINAAEWCRDLRGLRRGEVAIRGGSWDSDLNSRAAACNFDTPFLRIDRVGFRIVLVREMESVPPRAWSVCKVNSPHLP